MTRRSGLYCLGLAALAVAVVSMSAYAQPPGGGRGGRGGARGGPGFGGPLMLLMMPEVREELEMTEDQTTKLRESQRALFESMRSEGGRESFRDMSDEEREKRRAEMEKKTADMLKEVLLPKQVERLEQLALQREGTRALSNQKVINALKITPEQQAELTKIGEEAREQITELFRGGGRDASEEQRAQNREKMDAIRKTVEKKAMGVLSDEQKQALAKLMGKPFDFPEFQFRGPGGDRGGRGPRGGGQGGQNN